MGNRTSRNIYQDTDLLASTTYDYDDNGRMTSVTDNGATVSYTYDDNGNRASMTYGNGNTVTYTYNSANYPVSIVNKNGTTVLSSYDYTYSLDGNVIEKAEADGKTTSYTYDSMNRLTNEVETNNGSVVQSYSYAFDDFNNRSSLTATGEDAYTTTYSYDANNRLLKDVKTTTEGTESTLYFYDPNGNQIGRSMEAQSASTGTEAFSLTDEIALYELSCYNGLNQLISTRVNDSVVAYSYAPSGLRLSKTVDDAETSFLLDRDNVVAEQHDGVLTAYYARGLNLFASFIGDDQNYYLYNGHGDVVQLTDTSGAVSKTYEYDAFGNEKDPASNDLNPFRYCAEYFDVESGRYYLRARYYASQTGRMLAEDVLIGTSGNALSWNAYTYCWNNPLLYMDPSGNWPEISKENTREIARTVIANPLANYVTREGKLSNLFYLGGFVRDSKGIYHTRQDALQQIGGYNDFYDLVFDYGTSMRAAKFSFNYDGTDYIFWAWKGDYLHLGAGAELGIYKRLTIAGNKTDHWLVDTDLALPMTLMLTDKEGHTLFNYQPAEKQWWLTGFAPNYSNVQADDLTPIYSIDFTGNEGMYNAFITSQSYLANRNSWRVSSDNKYKLIYTFMTN